MVTAHLAVGELPVVEGKLKCPVPGGHGNYREGVITALGWSNYGSVFATVAAPTTSSGATMWGYGIRFGNNEKHQIIQPFSACFLYKRIS